jgi:hypothetical protein
MLRTAILVVFVVLVVACAKKEKPPAPPPTPPAAADAAGVTADAVAAAADAAAESTGAGSADAGSAAAGGAGSAVAGSAGSGDTGIAGAGSAAASSVVSAGDFDFSKLSRDDKIKFMKQKVMPAMKPLFQKFDPKNFAKFTCKTCHGKDPQRAKYEMPTPDLPPLDFEAIKAGKEDPKVVEFMSKIVKPEMAKLFHMPEMSESEPNGFGCLHCHTLKKK